MDVFIGDMKVAKALLITVGFFSFLFWIYVVARVLISHVRLYNPFISFIPFLSFFTVGIISFLVSFVCFFAYLVFYTDSEKS